MTTAHQDNHDKARRGTVSTFKRPILLLSCNRFQPIVPSTVKATLIGQQPYPDVYRKLWPSADRVITRPAAPPATGEVRVRAIEVLRVLPRGRAYRS